MDDKVSDMVTGFLKGVQFVVYGKGEICYSPRTSVQQNINQVCATEKFLTIKNYGVIIKNEGD